MSDGVQRKSSQFPLSINQPGYKLNIKYFYPAIKDKMPSTFGKLLIWVSAFTLVSLCFLGAQDTKPAHPEADSARAADSTDVQVPAAGDSSRILDTTSVAASTSADSGSGSDSTLAVSSSADTLPPRPGPPQPGRRSSGRYRAKDNSIDAVVIPWDWDDYTNVIEVGLRDTEGREYSLTKNETYKVLFTRYQGRKIRAWGKIVRDSDGFFSMTVTSFTPADSLQTESGARKRP